MHAQINIYTRAAATQSQCVMGCACGARRSADWLCAVELLDWLAEWPRALSCIHVTSERVSLCALFPHGTDRIRPKSSNPLHEREVRYSKVAEWRSKSSPQLQLALIQFVESSHSSNPTKLPSKRSIRLLPWSGTIRGSADDPHTHTRTRARSYLPIRYCNRDAVRAVAWPSARERRRPGAHEPPARHVDRTAD